MYSYPDNRGRNQVVNSLVNISKIITEIRVCRWEKRKYLSDSHITTFKENILTSFHYCTVSHRVLSLIVYERLYVH